MKTKTAEQIKTEIMEEFIISLYDWDKIGGIERIDKFKNFLSDSLDKAMKKMAKKMIGKKLKEVPFVGTKEEEDLFVGGWNEKRQEIIKIAKKWGVK